CRGRKTRGAEVLERGEQLTVEQLQTALEQLLLGERVADLHRWALRFVALAELGAGKHRRAADAVAAGERAQQQHDIADADGGARGQALVWCKPDAHRVDETVLFVASLEVDLASDRRHPDRVSVMADPGDRALEQVARAGRPGGLTEPQRVEHRDR